MIDTIIIREEGVYMVKVTEENEEVVVKGIIINHHFRTLRDFLENYSMTHNRIILNLKDLELIDDNGAKELMALAGNLIKKGKHFAITKMSDKVMSKFYQLGAKVWLSKNLLSKVG
ncbi:hypothetical protein Dtox_1096 [Desulfofarcimen acetoxidans DSM 771]|uniref:STAS domain-containing protein n=2 Tax=Desulfofarcimen acetoxidans TaxID=58138 RepID=C8W4B4_DESAS|nr:hypothetical protein Dtox_1096 [Desulfofarcimen acetoxidans DSM 771]